MSIKNPKKFWSKISTLDNWRDFILPNRTDENFDFEGKREAERLYYFFDENSVVIDYGCGIGRVIKHISERVGNAIGLDINKDFIEKANIYVKKNNIKFFVIGEYIEENVADLVYSIMVLQHNSKENRKEIVDNIKFLLKQGGRAIIQFPQKSSDYYTESNFVHKFSKKEVECYGKLFSFYEIIEGNLVNYGGDINLKNNHEYFLIAIK